MESMVFDGPASGKKRTRDVHDDGGNEPIERSEKKARPMSGDSTTSWPQRDSVINTPTASGQLGSLNKPKYDSDDQSSMMSEPGSPQDFDMSSSGDENMSDLPVFSSQPASRSPSFNYTTTTYTNITSNPWPTRPLAARVPTPIVQPGVNNGRATPPLGPYRPTIRQHLRYRHPQENLSSSPGRLEVPPLLEEGGVATPPSAAEAAGSQLSMLSVSDMDIEPRPGLPAISIETPTRSGSFPASESDFAVEDDTDSMDHDPRFQQPVVVRKQRQRSGALSAGGSSPSPTLHGDANARRGLSMGFRADCEKCRLRIPGHMNHFVS